MTDAGVAAAYLASLARVLRAVPADDIARVAGALEQARAGGRLVVLMGNGGSAATASHVALDLSKNTVRAGVPRLRVVALTDNVPMITAWANDTEYKHVFDEQVQNLVATGDLVVAFSCSGTSANVVSAVQRARSLGAITIGFTGPSGGLLKDLVDVCVMVPSDHVGQVEDAHLAIGHILTDVLAGRGAGEG